MKKEKINSVKLIVLSFVLFTIFSANATTYTTLANGPWNSSSIWSLDGVNACGCTPGSINPGENVIIKHAISTSGNLLVTGGSTLLIESAGELSGSNVLTVEDGMVTFYGESSFSKVEIKANGVAYFHGLVTLSSRITIDGQLIIDGGYLFMSSGNVSISKTGNLITENAGKLDAMGGNIDNSGLVDICFNCCMTTYGNWKNHGTGTVSGDGSATTTGGNMTNLGVWSPNVTWCSVGFDSGMPTAEDCANANTTCGLVVLPVELITFNAKEINGLVVVNWSTASERNSSHFNVLKSIDGKNWTTVAQVKAAGSSNEQIDYQMEDHDADFEVAYYKLQQVDVDGKQKFSPAISVMGAFNQKLVIVPNPSSISEGSVQLNFPNSEAGVIDVYDQQGMRVYHDSFDEKMGNKKLITTQFESGVYFVKISIGDQILFERLVLAQ